MTDGQRRMWFVQSIDTTGALLNIAVSYRLIGDLDADRLRRAVEAVAARHPILRTTYHTGADGQPSACLHDDLKPGWVQHDVRDLGAQARRLRLEVLAQRTFATPFDLSARRRCGSLWSGSGGRASCCCWPPTTSPGTTVRGGCFSPI